MYLSAKFQSAFPKNDNRLLRPPLLLTFFVEASPRASCRNLEFTFVLRRLDIAAPMNRLLVALASWPSNSEKPCLEICLSRRSVLLKVQSVELNWFSLMEFVKVGSEFSGKMGVKPANELCPRLKLSLDRNASCGVKARPPNMLPKTRLFFDMLSFCTHARLSGLVWLPSPTALPEAKLPWRS